MSPLRRIAVAPLLLASVLAMGCGSDESSSDGGKAAVVRGTGYSVQLPDGWKDSTKEASDKTSVADRVLSGPTLDGFTTNANVVYEPAPDASIAEVGAAFSKQVTGIGATNVSSVSERTLADDEAVTYTYELDQAGKQRRARQVAAIHGGRLYTVSMTAAANGFPDAEKHFDAILSSWSWR